MPNNLREYLNKNAKLIPLDDDSSFKFTCAKQCWGTCCREEHAGLLQLSVYDTYKMISHRPDLKTLELIQVKIENSTNLPRAYINWTSDRVCPNLMEDGICKIYMDRPFACSIFPMNAEFMITDETKEINISYKLRENMCFGFHKEANPEEQTLKSFLTANSFNIYEEMEKLEILKRDEWSKKYDLKKLSDKQIHGLAQTLYCLKEKVTDKDIYFFDVLSDMLKIPRRTRKVEEFSNIDLTKLALNEFTPRLLEKYFNYSHHSEEGPQS